MVADDIVASRRVVWGAVAVAEACSKAPVPALSSVNAAVWPAAATVASDAFALWTPCDRLAVDVSVVLPPVLPPQAVRRTAALQQSSALA
ncbi:MAG: hypothetical protein EOO78_02490 [Oxalobacteraceae bacterium]|nr:MAG: hypothetical protein EOO78_02490 [Oxalobacteraceae bacterium]